MFNFLVKYAVRMFFLALVICINIRFFSASNWTLCSIFYASKRKTSACQDAMTHSGYISVKSITTFPIFQSEKKVNFQSKGSKNNNTVHLVRFWRINLVKNFVLVIGALKTINYHKIYHSILVIFILAFCQKF